MGCISSQSLAKATARAITESQVDLTEATARVSQIESSIDDDKSTVMIAVIAEGSQNLSSMLKDPEMESDRITSR